MVSKDVVLTESEFGPLFGNLPRAKEKEQHLIKVMTLEVHQNFESVLFRLKKGWIVEFHLGPSLFGKELNIYTNHPKSVDEDFTRTTYQELEWKAKEKNSSENVFASLFLHRAGSFHYYFTESTSNQLLGCGYFLVDPVLSFGHNEVLNLDSLRCQTVLAKSLGTFDKWEDRLRVSRESGYNMIHFTPLQELGNSNSSYSLKDQLKLNPAFTSESCTPSFDDIFNLTNKMRNDWKVLSLGDIVLNHTANDSPWLTSHPECTYNMITAPHLIPAAILDAYLHVFTKEVAEGKFENMNIPKEVYTEAHLNAIRHYLEAELVPRMRLHEFFLCDVEKLAEEFIQKAEGRIPKYNGTKRTEIMLLKGAPLDRYQAKVDLELAVNVFNVCREGISDEKSRLAMCAEDFKKRLHELNSERKHELNLHLSAAVNNCIANMRYFRVQEGGPKLRVVSESSPLVPRYFTGQFLNYDSIETEILNEGRFVMAHNGWVLDYDPLKNFADPDSNVYLRRELIAWGDSVKLRYGNKQYDCPFLWNHMREYVEITAKIFDGVRLDNCHSTPLHVAEYLIDCARKVRPDLYVVAELFTNSDVMDNIFINKLGITSLIREAMSAWNSPELGRQIHRFGGEAVGSFSKMKKTTLSPSIAHALFYDATHDNPSPIEKKTVLDLIPTAGLVAMACCATGSSRGYDELVPHHIHVVNEKRLYPSWTDGEAFDNSLVNINTGLIEVKKVLNEIHGNLSETGFNEIYVDQMSEEVIAVTRHNSDTFEKIILIAHNVFRPVDYYLGPHLRNLELEGEVCEILLETELKNKNKQNYNSNVDFKRDDEFINGLTTCEVIMKQKIQLEKSLFLERIPTNNKNMSELRFKDFPPGSLVILRVGPHVTLQQDSVIQFLDELRDSYFNCEYSKELFSVVSKLNLIDLNYALYRCSDEEGEEGRELYDFPGFRRCVYGGLQGFESVLDEVRSKNNLGHPICENLRKGDWMLNYIVERLKSSKGTQKLGSLLDGIFEKLRSIPRYLIPKYFDMIISSLCRLLASRAAFQMSEFVRDGSTFVRLLATGSIQCVGCSKQARLPPFSPALAPKEEAAKNIMCAGLPHFSTGYMRSWGRDTFISLRGLLLLTGRHTEARDHILGYAACLRHGLIPNLLDGGTNARYNCRDAVWWWLYSIICYVDLVSNGAEILKAPVSRIFPKDDGPPAEPGSCDQPLHNVMQEALNVHFQGLCFRERNAGIKIDALMTDKGFNNRIGIDLETGFVYGGNEWNCGTWMDKMGCHEKSGNKGKPATPRDGSAVELVALCKAVVRKLKELHNSRDYPYAGVTRIDENGKTQQWSFKEWEEKIYKNFEKHFYIPETPSVDERRPDLVHRRDIYKDSVGASQPWADYQLRCNFPIALVVAPEMVDPEHAWKAIGKAEEILLGPLGVKTLDPADWNYNGYYRNDDDSDDAKVAGGFNYHQGPEWLWPAGFLLRSKLHFARLKGEDEVKKTVTEVRSYLGNHYREILSSPWRGLPELTNKNGEFCPGSCRVQAWSMACFLEVLYDLKLIEGKKGGE